MPHTSFKGEIPVQHHHFVFPQSPLIMLVMFFFCCFFFLGKTIAIFSTITDTILLWFSTTVHSSMRFKARYIVEEDRFVWAEGSMAYLFALSQEKLLVSCSIKVRYYFVLSVQRNSSNAFCHFICVFITVS